MTFLREEAISRERERESLNKEKGPEDSPSEFKEINTRLSEE